MSIKGIRLIPILSDCSVILSYTHTTTAEVLNSIERRYYYMINDSTVTGNW